MNPEDVLAELEDVIRSMPPGKSLRQETLENFSWLGRATTVLSRWSPRGAIQVPLLVPAAKLFAAQSGAKIEIRSAPGFHDRYVFVDRASCFQSRASFKDGGRAAPTTITQISDAFPAVFKTYEDLWKNAKPEI